MTLTRSREPGGLEERLHRPLYWRDPPLQGPQAQCRPPGQPPHLQPHQHRHRGVRVPGDGHGRGGAGGGPHVEGGGAGLRGGGGGRGGGSAGRESGVGV